MAEKAIILFCVNKKTLDKFGNITDKQVITIFCHQLNLNNLFQLFYIYNEFGKINHFTLR